MKKKEVEERKERGKDLEAEEKGGEKRKERRGKEIGSRGERRTKEEGIGGGKKGRWGREVEVDKEGRGLRRGRGA